MPRSTRRILGEFEQGVLLGIMRLQDALAEAILSLAATPERAESITGDFLEDDRGAFRFWLTVRRTVVLNLVVPLWLGRWISRRYPGHQAAGIVILAGSHTTINLCAVWILGEIARSGREWHAGLTIGLNVVSWYSEHISTIFHSALIYATLYPLLLLAGATSLRARHATQ